MSDNPETDTESAVTDPPPRLPSFDEIAIATAEKNGVCIRPMVLQQTDTHTGRVEYIPVPCGNTMESVCGPCARKARALRAIQCREGWHLDHEPDIKARPPTFDQEGLMQYRADQVAEHHRARDAGADSDAAELHAEIGWIDKQLTALGMRGNTPAPEQPNSSGADAPDKPNRSTRRRSDVADLPRNPIDKTRTIGREYAGRFRPSMFITLTLDSYGPVHRDDGTPVDPDAYDYERAAWDAITFAALVDRWIQNLRRVIGWDIQYFAAVEPQRRGAPHIHIALRGTVPRRIIKQVTKATYRHIWWPKPTTMLYSPNRGRLPLWDRDRRTFVDPHTHTPLQPWDEAIAAIDDDDEPAHVARFGTQVHYRGILAGTKEADRHIGYLCKYLTKSVSEALDATTARQHTHYDRLHEALCRTPCSPRCAVWLLYGIVPKGAKSRMVPGSCKSRAHRRTTLGLPGRRVLNSQRWTGKTLGDHKTERIEFVQRALKAVGIDKPEPEPGRYEWSTLAPGTRIPSRAYLLMTGVAQRIAWRAEYEQAVLTAPPPPDAGDQNVSATSITAIGQQQN
ncbi:replication initiator [Nocardia sp. CA-120079]|uniref:replication initiator n=1 Tax=Nocardia sp. CA-120079 TaxID=3239974 RepID=UPI003D975E31